MHLGSDQLYVNISVVGISEMRLGFLDEGIEDVRDTAIALAELLDEVWDPHFGSAHPCG